MIGSQTTEEETQDLDWFAIDSKGHVAHFATAGRGALPLAARQQLHTFEMLSRYFRSELGISTEAHISETYLNSLTDPNDIDMRERVVRDFRAFAEKGLFSFDATRGMRYPAIYMLVASPKTPLTIERLPQQIKKLISAVSMSNDFTTVTEIDAASV